jgi:elongation factor Ts
MAISPAAVKELRQKTGAGMMDCKRALVEAKGDAAKAEKLLKEMGLAAAAKRGGRATNEGRVFSHINDARGALLELSCETDFVARNEDFVGLGEKMVRMITDEGETVDRGRLEAMVADTAGIIKENMALKRFAVLEGGDGAMLTDYIHGEGRIGVMVRFQLSDSELRQNARVKEAAFDFALHIAAFAPAFLSRQDVSQDYIAEQESIFRKQVEGMDKPANVLDGIVKGKLNKHLAEICLLDQGFVKDEKVKCSKVLEALGKETGGKIDIVGYLYFRVGEEIDT